MKLNLWGDNQQGLTVAAGNAENMNCYTMPSSAGRNPIYLTGVMGTRLHATLNDIFVRARGCRAVRDVGYIVSFNTLFSVTAAGVSTALGSIPGTEQVSVTDDGVHVIICNGTTTGYYYNIDTDNFFEVTFPYAAYTVAFIGGYIIASSDGARFFISEVNNTTTFNALDFATAEKSPDDLTTAWEDNGELVLFGEKTTEIWYNSGNTDFAFTPNPAGFMQRGIYSRFAVCKEDNSTFFLGDNLIVYRMQGFKPVRMSNEWLEIKLSAVRDSGDQEDLRATTMYAYTEHGHTFVQINVPNQFSATFNIVTNEWFTVKHFNYPTAMGTCYLTLDSRHFIGGLDGNVYEMKRGLYSDAGVTLVRGRRTQFFSEDDKILHWRMIKFIMDFGTTPLLTGQGSSPQMVLRWSHDSGRTWRAETYLSLGVQGDYIGHAVKRNCGGARNRLIDFYVTDPVPFHVLDAYAEVD